MTVDSAKSTSKSSDDYTLSNMKWGSGITSFTANNTSGTASTVTVTVDNAITDTQLNQLLQKWDSTQEKAVDRSGDEVVDAITLSSTTAVTDTKVTEDGEAKITLTEGGYYIIKDTKTDTSDLGDNDAYSKTMLQVVGDVEVTSKHSIPTLEKTVKENTNLNDSTSYPDNYNKIADYDIGDEIPYRLVGTMPSTLDDYTTYAYTFTDNLSEGLTFDSTSVTVKIGETTFPATTTVSGDSHTNYTVTENVTSTNGNYTNGSTFTVSFLDVKDLYDASGDKIAVTTASKVQVDYKAKLNAKAVKGGSGNPNNAFLTYSNNPEGEGTGTTENKYAVVFTYTLTPKKVDKDTESALQGAVFALLSSDKKKVYTQNTTTKAVSWSDYSNDTSLTETDTAKQKFTSAETTGTFSFEGLDAGTYYLHEVTQPTGYNKLSEDIPVTITASFAEGKRSGYDGTETTKTLSGLAINLATTAGGTAYSSDIAVASNDEAATNATDGVVEMTVKNKAGGSLPSTGGAGRFIYVGFGAAGLALVIALLAVKKRKTA